MIETVSFRRRKLPHWRVASASYFVTFRQYGTIPPNVIKELKDRKAHVDLKDEMAMDDFQRFEFRRIESILDKAISSENILCKPEIASMIIDSFGMAEQKYKWSFPSVVVTPNHVHCLCVGQTASIPLDKFLMKFKGWTAYRANKLLGRTGSPFWAQESFDHWCRNSQKEETVKRYMTNNPVKAGLVKKAEEWEWRIPK